MLVATANPEDYTNRGRIITPLKDRFGAQVRTHYPEDVQHRGRDHGGGGRACPSAGCRWSCPTYMQEVLAEISQLARRSPHLNQRSGVSVRLTIANYETLVANALRRALRVGEPVVVPRVSDLAALVPSTQGKIEVEALEEGREDEVVAQLAGAAVLAVFRRRVTLEDPGGVVGSFGEGTVVHTGDDLASSRLPVGAGRHAGPRAPDPGAGRSRRGRVAGPHGGRARVPARGAAPHQAAQQGRLGRPGPLPPTPVEDAMTARYDFTRLGRHPGVG